MIKLSDDNDDYTALRRVLGRAVEQASQGKGKERHATPEPFEDQKIVQIGLWLGNTGFEIGQAVKKAIESCRLTRERAIAELLGAINYLAAAILVLERQGGLAHDPEVEVAPLLPRPVVEGPEVRRERQAYGPTVADDLDF